MQLFHFACALPIIVIIIVLALSLFKGFGLVMNFNRYFSHKSGPYQKNERGGIKLEWLIAILGFVSLLLALAPVQTLIEVANTLSVPAIEPGREQGALDLMTRLILGFVSLISFLTLGFVRIIGSR